MAVQHDLLSPKEIAQAIGVSESSVKRWTDRGLLKASRTVGGHRRIPLTEAVRFIRERGAPVVKPEILGLPTSPPPTDDPAASFQSFLLKGKAAEARGWLLSAYISGASLATLLLYAVAGAPAAALGVASILFYVFVYTVWLKPRSPLNAVVGGAAGAAAPLIADAAVNGSVGAAGWLLFAIIFFWQPPHVWAIALFRKADYARVGIPMLPNVIGDQPTRWRMLWYTLALVPVTLAPVPLGLLGATYLAAALALDAWFVWQILRVLRERSDAAARRAFHVSLAYLFTLFLAMLLDRGVHALISS